MRNMCTTIETIGSKSQQKTAYLTYRYNYLPQWSSVFTMTQKSVQSDPNRIRDFALSDTGEEAHQDFDIYNKNRKKSLKNKEMNACIKQINS